MPLGASSVAVLRAARRTAGHVETTPALTQRAVVKAAAPDLPPSACTVTGYLPTRISIGTSEKKQEFKPKVTGCELDTWSVWVLPFVDLDAKKGDATYYDGAAWQQRLAAVLKPGYLDDAAAGKHDDKVVVFALAVGETQADHELASAVFPLTLAKASRFEDVNASPEPATKGQSITVRGTLTRVRWNHAKHLKYLPYAKAVVQVQFRATGAAEFATVKTVGADTLGRVNTKVKAVASGSWRLAFAGISTTAPATSGYDNVVVTG